MEDNKLKPRWWCIEKECNHYQQFHCKHPTVPEGKVRVKELIMCPVLCDIEACLKTKK